MIYTIDHYMSNPRLGPHATQLSSRVDLHHSTNDPQISPCHKKMQELWWLFVLYFGWKETNCKEQISQ